MKLYTSYYAKLNRLPANIVPVNIALWPPKGVTIASFPALAPTADILREYKAKPDVNRYTHRYNTEVLTQYNPHSILRELKKLSHGNDVALICYEKSSDFCHRHLIAKWLTPALQAAGDELSGEWCL